MADLLQFTYPIPINEKVESGDIVYSNISQVYNVGKAIWTSLLGKTNKEIKIDALLSSPKFFAYIEKARQDFIINHADLNTYPKLDEKDWD